MCLVGGSQGTDPPPCQQLCIAMACPGHVRHAPLSPPQPIDYEGFRLFMKTYLEADVPEELCQHLFTSFKRKICQASPETQRQSPGVSQLNTLGEPALPLPSLPRCPTGMRVSGWHQQWVASGPPHSPALSHPMDRLPGPRVSLGGGRSPGCETHGASLH